jgi:pimeloyl-ACP methyl ester carboxylesterase
MPTRPWRAIRGFAWSGAAAAGAYVAGSWAAAIALGDALISPVGLAPGRDDRAAFLAALRRGAELAEEFAHPGDPRDPVPLVCTFASPGDAARRATLLFLHGKGGNATEWLPDALRALACGFNVLVPDLRGHGRSGGKFITFGLLEKGDLENAVAAAGERFGIDVRRLGVHACSYGGSPALRYSAGNPGVRALWLESPFGDALAMARHYLHLKSGVPSWALGLTTRWALARADARVRRALGLRRAEGLAEMDPVRAAERLRCPVALVYGRRDELTLPEFLGRLEEALPRTTTVWEVAAAGHCHHDDQPLAVEKDEYERRWKEFFGRLSEPGRGDPADDTIA